MDDLIAPDNQFTRDVTGCVQLIPQLKSLLPTLPALASWDASVQPAQVQQLVVKQQWFHTSSTVLRDALKLLQLGSSWQELGPGSTLHKYSSVLHVVGQAWRRVAVQLAGTTVSTALLRQTAQSGEQSSCAICALT
jgi:hypothetical protein